MAVQRGLNLRRRLRLGRCCGQSSVGPATVMPASEQREDVRLRSRETHPRRIARALQKWSKGKVKEKLSNLVLFDKVSYEKMLTDIPKRRLITPSIISEKLKVNGSLARKAVKELVSKELIRPIMTHKHQAIYTRITNT